MVIIKQSMPEHVSESGLLIGIETSRGIFVLEPDVLTIDRSSFQCRNVIVADGNCGH